MPDDTYSSYIEMKCVNDETGGPPFWMPPYSHDINPFPQCENLRKLTQLDPTSQDY